MMMMMMIIIIRRGHIVYVGAEETHYGGRSQGIRVVGCGLG